MIFIALGANLNHPLYGDPLNTLRAAIEEIEQSGLEVVAKSSWYKTAPVPISDQPWFVNAVIQVRTALPAKELLALLHTIERKFGRVREIQWEARVLDLDLLAYGDSVTQNQDQQLGKVIPHPRMHERRFVMAPLSEISPDWLHPVIGKTAKQICDGLPCDSEVKILKQG
ncbi:2-amino-4-hydroxy-6-hydroxymethyldihydropteridine diphosphokinase [Sneathiella glossodoripedis]|uniref:2-amino-4-hydroxy-6- hydroxymethyldihydropteridine diphosphokinase n=1 Tax=Sneathiella glossodoripedis TaxID=418853 RepID=UPI000472158A|nr:2-amino-4-hydroxy-6-hydroxymethyldihydropteridine diphosphokinase [Sneathiella glossodoripedis]